MSDPTPLPRPRPAAAAPWIALALLCVLAGPAFSEGGYRDRGSKPSPLDPVEEALDEKRYGEALDLLAPLREKDPEDADLWNLTGYARRKLGRLPEARVAYDRALELDPEHKRAHEYLGELFLQTGDLAGAERQLATLDDLCFFPCKEERKLRKAIEKFKSEGAAGG